MLLLQQWKLFNHCEYVAYCYGCLIKQNNQPLSLHLTHLYKLVDTSYNKFVVFWNYLLIYVALIKFYFYQNVTQKNISELISSTNFLYNIVYRGMTWLIYLLCLHVWKSYIITKWCDSVFTCNWKMQMFIFVWPRMIIWKKKYGYHWIPLWVHSPTTTCYIFLTFFHSFKWVTITNIWASPWENLSLGFPKKWVSNQSPQLQRLAR